MSLWATIQATLQPTTASFFSKASFNNNNNNNHKASASPPSQIVLRIPPQLVPLWNYLWTVPTDAYLFVGTTVVFWIHCQVVAQWRRRRRRQQSSRQRLTPEEIAFEARMHALKKETDYKKDPQLYATIKAMEESKKTLRSVADPDQARRAKQQSLKTCRQASGPLGLSDAGLQSLRSQLKKTPPTTPPRGTTHNNNAATALKESRRRLRQVTAPSSQ